LQNAQNRRKPNNCKKGKHKLWAEEAAWPARARQHSRAATTTGYDKHHGPTVVITGSAGLLVSPVASSWFIMARDAWFGTSVLGHSGPVLAFFFDLQGLKIIFYYCNLGL